MADNKLVYIATGHPANIGRRRGKTNSDNEAANFPPDLTAKNLSWHLVERIPKPSFDQATHRHPTSNNGLVDGIYVHDWNAPVAYTQQELDERAAAAAAHADEKKDAEVDREVSALLGKVAFDMEKRVRVLEGKSPVTATQYKAALKGRL